MQSMKETAANIAASAKAGMEKTKATVQEKVEKMTAHHPTEKEMATEKKEERINQAERHKQEMKQSARVGGGNTPGYHTTTTTTTTGTGTGTGLGSGTGTGTASYSTIGAHGQPTGANQMSALPGHGTGQPTGQVVEGVAASHPIGKSSGTGHVPAHNTRVGGNPASYGTGGTYS